MNMHNPAYPGELLTGWLDDLSVSVTGFAASAGSCCRACCMAMQPSLPTGICACPKLWERQRAAGWRCKLSEIDGQRTRSPKTASAWLRRNR